jgi:exodeoxyribonuclease-1
MKTFFFYDLETSGFNPRSDRIMQFGGQRTDMELRPIGEPVNLLIELSEDVLPGPDAIMVTGITPQKTKQEGLKEAEFIKIFNREIATPDTIFVGFNSIRFDDEFMRYFNWRNFNDPYEWQWKEGRSRWDLLDVVRMTRALRPKGIKWAFDSKGKPANRLEMLTSINKLSHSNAHDALSDVHATIDLARLIKTKQPKLFEYLLEIRDKKKVASLVGSSQPFVYVSGKYEVEYEKATVAVKLCDHPKKQGAIVYDLRFDPNDIKNLSAEELVKKWQYDPDNPDDKLPLKTLLYNRCPAVAPISVLDDESQKRLKIDMGKINDNAKKLEEIKNELCARIVKALEILDKKQQVRLLSNEQDAENQLYDGFVDDIDRNKLAKLRQSDPSNLLPSTFDFKDSRLEKMIMPYKARNYPKSLTDEERVAWDSFKSNKLLKSTNSIDKYFARIEQLSQEHAKDKQKMYLLEELKLYGESLI